MANMYTPGRDLLVLLKNEFISEQAIEDQVRSIHQMLVQTESPEQFCAAHELATRNRITHAPRKILKAIRYAELPAFHFLINRN